VEPIASRQLVARCCDRAAAAGVRQGMTLAHARALLSADHLTVADFDPAGDLARLHALARWATRFTPLVTADPPDGLLLDVAGCQRLFRGERALVDRLIRDVERLGFQCRPAVAPTFGCAWAMARFAQPRQHTPSVPDDGVRQALVNLPVAGLRLDEATQTALRELGIESIGQLLDLPRRSLPARFGETLLLRLDQALGQAVETIDPVRFTELPRSEMVFDGPTTQLKAIDLAVRRLLDDLANQLEHRGCGVRQLDLTLARSDAGPVAVTVNLSRPSRNAKHLWSLLAPRLEQADLGFGIERVELVARHVGRLRHRQLRQWSEPSDRHADADESLGELFDTMISRLGPARVTRVRNIETHLPERAFDHQPIHQAAGPHGDDTPRALPHDRPSMLFRRPEPAMVVAVAPDGPLSRLRWRRQDHPVVTCRGPQRISREWWRHPTTRAGPSTAAKRPDALAPATRDYFMVQTATGQWLWVFRQLETGCWFVHGLWA
jgi:protein ImuB